MGLLRDTSLALSVLLSPQTCLYNVGETSPLPNKRVDSLLLKGVQHKKRSPGGHFQCFMNVKRRLKKKKKAILLFLCLPESIMHIHPALKTNRGIPWRLTCWYQGSNLVEKKIGEEVPPYLQGNVSNNLTSCCSLCNSFFFVWND